MKRSRDAANPPASADAASEASFEDNVARLEGIVAELEGDGLDLDRALRLFEEGVERLRAASGELSRVEQQVKLLVERTDGTFALPPLGP